MRNKTDPIGIRFDIPDLQEVKVRERLLTPQQVVYFLFDFYKERVKFVPIEQPEVNYREKVFREKKEGESLLEYMKERQKWETDNL